MTTMFVIYRRPLDHPAHYVVRKWLVLPHPACPLLASLWCTLHDTLDEARESMPRGLRLVPHEEGLDPVIAERWIA